MALPVTFRDFTPQNSRHDLLRKLHAVPTEHVEAILSAYELLQRLHEKGLLDLASGLLSASDTVVARAVDVVSSKQAVAALRLLLITSNALERIDVDQIHALLTPSAQPPQSLWKILRQAMSRDCRRALGVSVSLLGVIGAALSAKGGQQKSS